MRTTKRLNDEVDRLHVALSEDDRYRALIAATTNAQAMEGSVRTDRTMAAKMIRDAAAKNGNALATEPLATIRKALGVVLRRYGA